MYRLQPLEQPEPLQRMDPLTRGSIFHEIQARFFRALQARGALPVTAANLDDGAVRCSTERSSEVAAREHDELAPAVERVWADEMRRSGATSTRWLALPGGGRRGVGAGVFRVRRSARCPVSAIRGAAREDGRRSTAGSGCAAPSI